MLEESLIIISQELTQVEYVNDNFLLDFRPIIERLDKSK